MLKYYLDLFTSSNPTEFSKLLDAIHPKVLQEMNHMLLKDFQACEVSKALK